MLLCCNQVQQMCNTMFKPNIGIYLQYISVLCTEKVKVCAVACRMGLIILKDLRDFAHTPHCTLNNGERAVSEQHTSMYIEQYCVTCLCLANEKICIL